MRRDDEARAGFLHALLLGDAEAASSIRLDEALFLLGMGWVAEVSRPRSARRLFRLVGVHRTDIAARAHLLRPGRAPPPDGLHLPQHLNIRVAAALSGSSSKGMPDMAALASMGVSKVVRDGGVRIRATASLVVGEMDISPILTLLGEVSLPVRLLGDGLSVVSTAHSVLVVENEGVFAEVRPEAGWLTVMAPGTDTAGTSSLLRRLTPRRVVHFGDLDTAGMAAAGRTRSAALESGHAHHWLVPPWVTAMLPSRGRFHRWPDKIPAWARTDTLIGMVQAEQWLEQEVMVMDPRLSQALRDKDS